MSLHEYPDTVLVPRRRSSSNHSERNQHCRSSFPKQRPMTSGTPYIIAHSRPPVSYDRANRLSYNPPPTYLQSDWLENRDKGEFDYKDEPEYSTVIVDEPLYTDPFNDLPGPSTSRPTRQHTRRPSSLAESLRNGLSNVKSLGRRMSLTMRGRKQTRTDIMNPEVFEAPQAQQQQQEMALPVRPKSGVFPTFKKNRRKTSMPLMTFGLTIPGKQDSSSPLPAFTRSNTTSTLAPPVSLQGGAGARASAAARNAEIQLERATPLPAYRSRSASPSDEFRDDESGIGIAPATMERQESRTYHIAKLDPAARLPNELLQHIAQNLDAKSLTELSLVSSRWNDLCASQTLWAHIFYRDYDPHRTSNSKNHLVTPGTGRSTKGQDFRRMYATRKALEKRWERGQAAAIYLNGHKDSVYCVQFDEDKIITGSRDNTIRIWDARTYQCLHKIAPPNNARELAPMRLADFEPSGEIRPIAMLDSCQVEPVAYKRSTMWHNASVLCLQYDSEILVSGSSDFTAIVWSIKEDYKPLFRLVGHRAGVLDVCIDAHRIVTCSKDTTIKIWDRFTGRCLQTLAGHRGPVNAVQVRGNLLASASGDGMSKLWRLDTGTCIKEFRSKERGLACVEFSEDGRTIFAGGNDHVIYEYDTTDGRARRELTGHTDLVRSLHLDSANGRIISGSYDHSIKVWDISKGKSAEDGGLQIDLAGWTSSWMLAAKSNYRKIACASQDSRVVIVDFGYGLPGVELLEA